jgi:hypothetical protein
LRAAARNRCHSRRIRARDDTVGIDAVVPMASTIPATYMGMTTAGTLTADWEPDSGELQIREVTL